MNKHDSRDALITIEDDLLDGASGGDGLIDLTLIKFPDFKFPDFFSTSNSNNTTTTTNPPPKSGLLGLGILGIL